MQEQEAAEGEVHGLGERQLLGGLGEGEHLAEARGPRGHLVARSRVEVHGVDAAGLAHDLREGHGHPALASTNVNAGPTRAELEALEGREQWAVVDVVAQRSAQGLVVGGRHRTIFAEAASLRLVDVVMMLADSAQVADGKLFILGGGWSITGPGPVPSAVVIKLNLDWSGASQSHHWVLALEDEDGRPVMLPAEQGLETVEISGDLQVDEPVGLVPGSSLDFPIAIQLGPLPLEPGRRFTWRFYLDGETLPGSSVTFATRPLEA